MGAIRGVAGFCGVMLVCSLFVRAQAREQVVLPIVVNGGSGASHFQTTFRLVSLAGTTELGPVVGDVLGFEDDPQPEARLFCLLSSAVPPIFPFTQRFFRLESGSVANIASSGNSVDLFDGWARVTLDRKDAVQVSAEVSLIAAAPPDCPEGPINICGRPSTEVVSSIQIPAVKPARRFRAQATVTEARHTALALVNPSETETATVELEVLDEGGGVYRAPTSEGEAEAVVTIQLAPLESRRMFLWDFLRLRLPGCAACPSEPLSQPQMFHGSVTVSSDLPIAVGGVQVLLPEGKFVNLPVDTVP